jgi:hypothetical protein
MGTKGKKPGPASTAIYDAAKPSGWNNERRLLLRTSVARQG